MDGTEGVSVSVFGGGRSVGQASRDWPYGRREIVIFLNRKSVDHVSNRSH